MRQRKAVRQLSKAVVLALFFCTSCGILGDKESKNKTTQLNQSTGCLDQLGPLLTAYLKGEVNPVEWSQTWDCVDSTLQTFTDYVKGSAPDGFTEEDIQLLVSRFIITSKPITPAYISGILSLKASLFGGSDKLLTKSEVAQFRKIAQFLKKRTVSLIPRLWNYRNAPTRENLDAFSNDLSQFGTDFVGQLSVDGNKSISKEQLTSFVTELGKDPFSRNQADIQDYADLFFEAKAFLLRGERTSLSAPELLDVISIGSELGARYIATASNEPMSDTPAKLKMLDSVQNQLLAAFRRWGGKIPFSVIEAIVDATPNKWLPTRAADFKDGFNALLHPRTESVDGHIKTIPSGMSSLLKNSQPGQDGFLFPANATDLFSLLTLGFQTDHTLDQLYEGLGRELSATEFATRIKTFATSGQLDYTSATEIARITRIANSFPGLFAEGSSTMRWNGVRTHSKTSLSRLNWLDRATRRLLEGYGSFSDASGEPMGDINDLLHLIKDTNSLLRSLSLVHPDTVDVHKKRFREANLFMSLSNGDGYLDIPEVTEYISHLMSASKLSDTIIDTFFRPHDGQPALCKQVGFDPKVQLPTYDLDCFRREYRDHFSETFKDYPFLLTTLARSSDDTKKTFFEKLEAAAKFTGYDNVPIGEFDISSYSGIAHYVESVMQRFDKNGGKADLALDRSEVLNQIFPIFEGELTGLSNIKIKMVNQALLLYLMQYGKSPFECNSKPTVKEIAKLVVWLVEGGPFKNFAADRTRVYQIFGALSATGTSCTSATELTSASLEDILEYFPTEL